MKTTIATTKVLNLAQATIERLDKKGSAKGTLDIIRQHLLELDPPLVQSNLPLTDTEKAALYLDWFNNYNTLQHFAHCKGLTRQEASSLIAEGRRIHEASVKPTPRTFTCITVSSNTNSFGYRGVLFLAPDGTGFECLYAFGAELPVRGQDVVEDKLPTYCRRTLAPTLPKKAAAVIKSAKA